MAHILLIEDDSSQVALLERWLPEHTLVVCSSGDEARAVAPRQNWDLVISDVEVPGANGLDLLRDRGSAAPTLIITGHADLQLALKAMKLGASDMLPKPFCKADLRASVDKLLAESRKTVRRVLAIGAHPDDVEIGVGGILANHRKQGHHVAILTLSGGAAGGQVDTRAAEALRAASILGAELTMADLPDTRISGGPETIAPIEALIASFRPDVVYTHTPNDQHQDHRAVYEATRIAARGVSSLYCYQSPSTTIDFRPARFVDIERELDHKLAALAAYQSQAQRDYLAPELIRSTAAYWGRFARYGIVEPLEIVREATSAQGSF